MNIFNESEFLQICNKLNAEPHTRDITIEYSREGFFKKMQKAVKADRRGEVVFCVIRPNGKAVVVTCSEYPEGIFRVPTGGVGHNEDIIEAVYRETKEELGLDIEIISFIGILKIKFVYKDESFMFYSYLFLVKETGGRILLDATDNEISQVREVSVEELEQISRSLNNIPGMWNDWGRFRYETTIAIYEYLKEL